jgi:hypothetical protein
MERKIEELFKIVDEFINSSEFAEIADALNDILKNTENVSETDILKENKDFLDILQSYIPELQYKLKDNIIFLFKDNPENGVGKIVYSYDKRKYYYYIERDYFRKKVFTKKENENFHIDNIIKYIKEIEENIKRRDYVNYLKVIEPQKIFNLKLFKKNIEKDLGIKLKELRLDSEPPITFFIKYKGNVLLSKITKYIDDYIYDLRKKDVKLPDRIEIKGE